MDEAVQVAAVAQGRNSASPRFILTFEHERPSIPVSLDALIDVNAEHVGLCAWAREAVVGAEYRIGGGASPLCIVRRVA